MNKRIMLLLLICAVAAVGTAGAAERIDPPFLIDTETTAYLPLGMGLHSDSMIDPGTFGLSQDLTFVDPGSTLGVGLRVGLEDSPLFGTLTIPVHAVVSAGYNMKLGVGATFLLDEPTTTLSGSPSGLITSGIMSFTWPIAEIGPSYLGLLFGIQGYTWSYEDSFGDTMSEYHLSMNIGASLAFDPVQHPANRSLYPDYTESYDY